MMQYNYGGPAFPINPSRDDMSLRDWFAGQALAGILAGSNTGGTWADDARSAYLAADAMLAARKTSQTE